MACTRCPPGWSGAGRGRAKRDEPPTGSRVQQTCDHECGATRHGGEKPRRRNMRGIMASAAPKGASASGSGHTRGMSVEGRLRTNPTRGGVGESRHQRTEERSEREDKVRRAGVRRLRPMDGGRPRKPSKARPVTAKGQGGQRERLTTRYWTQA
jgi:hypothetical protein